MKNFEEEIPKHQSKKNTRKWCKGKKGVQHSGKWVKNTWYRLEIYEYRCIHCNKKLKYWFESKWMMNKKPASLIEAQKRGEV